MQQLFVLILFVFVFISCNDESIKKEKGFKSGTTEKKTRDYKEKTFIAILEGEFTKDDTFQLLYSDTEEPYTGLDLVKGKVVGKAGNQEIIFTLPKRMYPYKIRLDVGNNKEQESIKIKRIRLKYEKLELIIEGSDFLTYFKPNPWIKKSDVDPTVFDMVVKDIQVSNTKIVSYAPYFNSNPKLIKSLEEL